MTQTIANRYRIESEIGKGGMGTVYKGLDTHTEQIVAIKHLKPELAELALIERFKREGEALRDLNHPNIVKMLDTVEENDNHYLIIEYLAGGDLSDLLKKDKLPTEKVLQIAIDICDALTRAHRLNIIHRDLKPANVLIAQDGTPRLTDFGVAHVVDKDRLTGSGVMIGTLDYMPPEALNSDAIDTSADIWGFGVMLFEMLAGKRPFIGVGVAQILMAIMTQPVPDLEALRPDVPIALIDLVYRMLEKSRDARIRSVRQVGLDLEDILHGRTTQTPPETRFAPETPDFLHRPKHNLPAQTTPFVGRESELSELEKLLDDPKIRLITVLAPGGMGKTRLALEAAEHQIPNFDNGVYFIELAPLTDVANIISAIAEATGYQFQGDEREPKQQILDFLRNKNMLLVLDNFEHLMDGAALVTDILQAAPDVQILATSRQRLRQPGESLFHLSGMDFPEWETPADAMNHAAVKLFMNSAHRAQPSFELTADNLDYIARICRLVQGMPLGIVLAAAWLAMLSPQEIADEIAQGIDFLADEGGEVPERQRSIRVVMDDSWQHMTEAEQLVFMKLSVFRSGFTREAAQVVADATLRILMNLMNKAMIRRNSTSGRYEIHELLRQYADEKLRAAGEMTAIKETHRRYYADFMQQRTPDIKGRRQLACLHEIEADFENVHLAWNRAVDPVDYMALDRMMEGLVLFCDIRSKYQVGADLFQQAVNQLAPLNADEIHSTFNRLQVRLIQVWTLPEQAPVPHHIRQQLTNNLTLAQQHDDLITVGLCLWLQGELERIEFNFDVGMPRYEQALTYYEQLADDYYIGRIQRGIVHITGTSNQKMTRNLNQQHLAMTRSSGDRSGLAHALWYEIAFVDDETALQLMYEALAIWREMGDWKSVGVVLEFLSMNRFFRGLFDEAQHIAKESLQLLQDCGYSITEIASLVLGLIASVKEDDVSARQLLEQNVTQYKIESFANEQHTLLKGLAIATLARLDNEKSEQYILSALQLVYEPFIPIAAAGCIAVIAVILAEQEEKERAAQLLGLAFTHSDHYLMGWMDKWPRLTRLRDQLKHELGAEAYNAAWERGKSLDLETVVQGLLKEFNEKED